MNTLLIKQIPSFSLPERFNTPRSLKISLVVISITCAIAISLIIGWMSTRNYFYIIDHRTYVSPIPQVQMSYEEQQLRNIDLSFQDFQQQTQSIESELQNL